MNTIPASIAVFGTMAIIFMPLHFLLNFAARYAVRNDRKALNEIFAVPVGEVAVGATPYLMRFRLFWPWAALESTLLPKARLLVSSARLSGAALVASLGACIASFGYLALEV